MANCIIIDDENKARQLLRNMLADVCPQMNIMAECDDLPSGVKAIKKYKPDLIFLDIEMPGHSGLEILDYFEEEEKTFEIIFCTGYSEYAIQAFKLSAIDYLLKPINPITLKETTDRYLNSNKTNKSVELQALQHNFNHRGDASDKCIVVNLVGTTRFLKVKDIIMLKAEGSYCEIYLDNGEKLLTSKNLKYFEERLLDISYFFRSHKSFMVNLKKVEAYNRSDNEIILIKNCHGMLSVDKSDLFLSKMEALH